MFIKYPIKLTRALLVSRNGITMVDHNADKAS